MHQHLHPRELLDARMTPGFPTSTVLETPVQTTAPITSSSSPPLHTPTRTLAARDPIYTCDPDEAWFLNACWLSRFSRASSDVSGLNDHDRDLRNMCYLPWGFTHSGKNSSSEAEKREESPWPEVDLERPDYQREEAPCKRASAIGGNCHFQNNNGTFSGLDVYKYNFAEQQHCYCKKYPYWDPLAGCHKCLEMHGGIEGYHWFPESHISLFAKKYCGTAPEKLDKNFDDFYKSWTDSAPEAQLPSTTAKDVLGTQTAVSLYYTPSPAAGGSGGSAPAMKSGRIGWMAGAVTLLCASYLIG